VVVLDILASQQYHVDLTDVLVDSLLGLRGNTLNILLLYLELTGELVILQHQHILGLRYRVRQYLGRFSVGLFLPPVDDRETAIRGLYPLQYLLIRLLDPHAVLSDLNEQLLCLRVVTLLVGVTRLDHQHCTFGLGTVNVLDLLKIVHLLPTLRLTYLWLEGLRNFGGGGDVHL
jgi:hypothetical protein